MFVGTCSVTSSILYARPPWPSSTLSLSLSLSLSLALQGTTMILLLLRKAAAEKDSMIVELEEVVQVVARWENALERDDE